ncbi:MAG: hypothetical protein KIS87_14495 [Phycisphaeraceae bacterium]|nr:hypothetical protein [Phycisphaeraceae bacterium]
MKRTFRSTSYFYDARGKPIRLADPRLLPRTVSAGVRDAAVSAWLLSWRSIAIIVVVAAVVSGARLAARASRPSTRGSGSPTWFDAADVADVTAFTFSILLVYMLIAWRIRRKSQRKAVLAWLSIGHCAACGYSLRALGPEFDGAVLCPECGAAWRLAPGSTPTPHEPAPTDGR